MPEVGPLEILVIAVIALIVFGPEKLPDMARNAGRFLSDLRRVATDVRSEFHGALDEDDHGEESSPDDDVEDAVPAATPDTSTDSKRESEQI